MNKYHAAFVPAALLVVALAPLPYGYYTFLRLVVTGWSLFLAWDEYRRQRSVNVWSISFLLIAALFNPLVPIHLERESWRFLDTGCAILFGAFAGGRLAGKPS